MQGLGSVGRSQQSNVSATCSVPGTQEGSPRVSYLIFPWKEDLVCPLPNLRSRNRPPRRKVFGREGKGKSICMCNKAEVRERERRSRR